VIRDRVLEILNDLGVQYAVVGAVAVAARGVARSTVVLDILTIDTRVFDAAVWMPSRDMTVDVRKGDVDDPLAGELRDEADRATASLSKEMTFRQQAQERGLLMLVEAAIGRVNNGTFGECLNCGQEIGANRLNAVPWSRYCITCQELIVEQG